MLGKNGTYYGRLWTFHDITIRKQTEVSLRLSEEKFRGLVENFRDAIVTVDLATGNFSTANPAAIKMFGAKNEEELLSKSPAAVSPERQPDGVLSAERIAQVNAALAHGAQHFEWLHRRLPGGEFSAEVLLTRMEHLGKPVTLATIRDITGPKLANAKLRESEEKFRQLAANVSDMFWITSPDLNQIQYVSPAYERIWGRSMADFYANPRQWFDAILPEERARVFALFQSLSEGTPDVSTEYRVARPDGNTRWVHNRGFQVRDDAGKVVRLAGIASDITERKRLESELFQARKLESIGQLAAGIAHEINTPTQYVGDNTRFVKDSFTAVARVLESHESFLAAAKAGAITPDLIARAGDILSASDWDYLRGQIPQALQETLEGVERVSKIVRAMKEFSHPGGREKTPADLNKAIESTATVARNEWKYVSDLKLELDPALPFVPCFLGEFNQAILNLIINAAHAIDDVVKAHSGTKGLITIQTRRAGDYVQVCVTDTGTGIPEAARPKIFEPFFTTKAVGKGTGQGLAMVYGTVVNRHGGTVSFETEVGRGTTFIIRLPIKSKGDPVPPAPAASTPVTITQ
jgi:PAS domain S-box-containing protein